MLSSAEGGRSGSDGVNDASTHVYMVARVTWCITEPKVQSVHTRSACLHASRMVSVTQRIMRARRAAPHRSWHCWWPLPPATLVWCARWAREEALIHWFVWLCSQPSSGPTGFLIYLAGKLPHVPQGQYNIMANFLNLPPAPPKERSVDPPLVRPDLNSAQTRTYNIQPIALPLTKQPVVIGPSDATIFSAPLLNVDRRSQRLSFPPAPAPWLRASAFCNPRGRACHARDAASSAR